MSAPMEYTTDNMEAALCLWESYTGSDTHDRATVYVDIAALRASVGTAELRTMFMDHTLLNAVDKGYEIAVDAGFCDPFDWEFCPSFLRRCVVVTGERLTLRPGWEYICTEIGKEIWP